MIEGMHLACAFDSGALKLHPHIVLDITQLLWVASPEHHYESLYLKSPCGCDTQALQIKNHPGRWNLVQIDRDSYKRIMV
jgi:hypothetical protein